MLHPSYTDLIDVANKGVEEGDEPIVSSRYSIILAAAKRARQLVDGADPLVSGNEKKPLSVAVEELAEDQIHILPYIEEEETIEASAVNAAENWQAELPETDEETAAEEAAESEAEE
jgi:DNA-directed RNA polymerase subunit omega